MVSPRRMALSGMVLSLAGVVIGVAALERHQVEYPAGVWLDAVFVTALALCALVQAQVAAQLPE